MANLVSTVRRLIDLAGDKKEVKHAAYEVEKAFDILYGRATTMVKQGETVPGNSMYFARLEHSRRGVANPSLVIAQIARAFPAVADMIPAYEARVRNELVERLVYGVRPRKH